MHAEELRAWLHLLSGTTRGGARRLLARHGGPEAALAAGPQDWSELLKPDQVKTLQSPDPRRLEALVTRTERWLEGAESRSLMLLGDADYPPALLNTADPPLMLHLDGRRELLGRRCIAVVGSRQPSPQGADNARHFAQGLGQAGFCVVSGMALGIDAAAHDGAQFTEGGTIAVLGCGVDQVYPLSHADLARSLTRRGLLVSEYFVGTPPIPDNFPQRNRIIAGMSEGCLVVEAALKSGSLITARLALEAGREVFAVPGNIHSPQSRGCHQLLKQGACLVQEVEDLLAELPPIGASAPAPQPSASTPRRRETAPSAPPPAAADDHPLLKALGLEPMSMEQLSQRSGWPTAELSAALLDLELAGRVARLPGALFQRRSRA